MRITLQWEYGAGYDLEVINDDRGVPKAVKLRSLSNTPQSYLDRHTAEQLAFALNTLAKTLQ